MTFSEATAGALSLLTTPSSRDRQRRVGPSDLGDACQRCLAEKMLGTYQDTREGTPLAPLIGTAFHHLVDALVQTHRPEGVLTESMVEVGEAGAYGVVKGTMDWFDTCRGHGIDWKVVSKKRVRGMARAFDRYGEWWDARNATSNEGATLTKYLLQVSMYGFGMSNMGFEVRSLSLVLIPRDASVDVLPEAATEIEVPFRPDVAQRVLDRAGAIYEWASSHPDGLTALPSDPYCYHCRLNR